MGPKGNDNVRRWSRIWASGTVRGALLIAAVLTATLSVGAQINVTTSRYNNQRTHVNGNESILTPANVNTEDFGKLFSQPVDGYVYAQPLYVANLTISGAVHNVVYVATEHDSVYAFDADTNTGANAQPLWHTSFLSSGVTTVSSTDINCGDINPEYGITGTPVIDLSTNILYVVAETLENSGTSYVKRLHALNILTGAEMPGSPVVITASVTVPGQSAVTFDTEWEQQRAGLLLYNGVVYIGFGSHCDENDWRGWILGYSYTGSSFSQPFVFSTEPSSVNGRQAGIWMAGEGLPMDMGSNLFVATANGQFDTTLTPPINYGDSVIRIDLSQGPTVQDYFTPADQATLDGNDQDLGSGGIAMLFSQSGPDPDLLVQVGKEGTLRVINRDNMGHFNSSNDSNVQDVAATGGVFASPVYFNGKLYVWGSGDYVRAFTVTNGRLSTSSTDAGTDLFGFPGATPIISANGTSNAILWAVNSSNSEDSGPGGPGELFAYNANDLAAGNIYNSFQNGSRDNVGGAIKFEVPTVVNGKVYVGAEGQLSVLGELGSVLPTAATPQISPSSETFTGSVSVSITDSTTGATILYTTDGSIPPGSPTTQTYSSSFNVTATTVVNAIATESGFTTSALATATYTLPGAPTISSLSLTSGPVGSVVTIAGTNFGATQGSSTVTFNGTAATVTSWSATSIATSVPTGATTGNVVVTVGGVASNGVTFTVTASAVTINYGSGFPPGGMLLLGNATLNGTALQLTDGGTNEAAAAWYGQQANIEVFTTDFTFLISGGTNPTADGFTFAIQGDSSSAIGALGGSLGYGSNTTGGTGIPTSVAVKFDLYGNNGEGVNSTGLYINGASPTVPAVDMTGSGVNLHSGDPFHVHLLYDGANLTMTITDTTTNATFTYTWQVNIPTIVGDNAFVGFTGGTGGDTAIQAIQTWTFTSTLTGPSTITSLSPTSGPAGTSVTITGKGFGATQGTSIITFTGLAVTGPELTPYFGTTATATSWSAKSIVTTVPAGATSGNVVVTVGGVASNGVAFTATPNITSLSTTSGPVGTAVTITGTGFGPSRQTSTVAFNGTTATVTSWSATSLVTSVPTGATTGSVVVTVGGVASNGVGFTVGAATSPTISSLSTTSGPVATAVTITGTNFGSSQGSSTVAFNGTTATVTSWSATSLVTSVPTGATTGNVVVTVGGVASNGVTFTVTTSGSPAITSLSTTSGPVGTAVTITGTNFGSSQGSSTVTFNGTIATVTSWSATSVVTSVPTGATTGNVVVTVGGIASNGVAFTVKPAITSLSTTSGAVGTAVTITGTSFGSSQGSSTVTFNGTTATVTSWSATSLVTSVPTGATTGNVVVTVGGVASNGVSFTVTSGGGGGGIKLVQDAGVDAGTTASASLAFPANNTAGNWIGVCIRGGAASETFTVTDLRGNTYNKAIQTNQTDDGDTVAIFYAQNIAGGANTITVSETPTQSLRFAILEYSGVATSGSLDVTAAAQGNSTAPNSGTATTTANGDLLLGVVMTADPEAFTAGSGYVIEATAPAEPGTKVMAEDQIQTTAGTFSAGATLGAADDWAAVAAAFKEAGGGGGTTPTITSVNNTTFTVGVAGTFTVTTSGSPVPSLSESGALPNLVTFNDNGNGTATLSGAPAAGTGGTYTITITASNGVGAPANQSFTLTVSTCAQNLAIGNFTLCGEAYNDISAGTNVKVNYSPSPGNSIIAWATWCFNSSCNSSISGITATIGDNINTTESCFVASPHSPFITDANGGAQGSGDFQQHYVWYCPSIPAGVTSFTVTPSNTNLSFLQLNISEWKAGSLAASCSPISACFENVDNFGQAGNSTGGTTATITTSGPTVNANDLIFAVTEVACCSFTASPGTGYSGITVAPSVTPGMVSEAKAATAGTQTATTTWTGGSTPWFGVIVPIIGAGSAVSPSISSLSQTSGPVGTAVTITGTGFGSTQATSTVTFNGTAATVTSWSATSLVTSVPTGATTGNVVVTVGGLASNGVAFTVTPGITSLSPTSGFVGTTVTIMGTSFGSSQGSSTVTFNGTTATVTSWSATSLVTSVPTGATTGNVVVTVGGVASNGVTFTLQPSITGLTPDWGLAGTSITIAGINFGATQGSSTVTFNGTSTTPTSWSATSIAAPVPSGATSGGVVVTVGGVASGGLFFTVGTPPVISSLSPESGAVGTPVTIAGVNFGTSQGTSTVTFNGTAATVTSWSATSLVTSVPSGATTGNVFVTVGGVGSNGFGFTVSASPSITSLSTTSGAVGTAVTITGTNFGSTQGTSTVTFNGTTATVTSWSATSLVTSVPTGATTGNVVVTVGGAASNGVAFTVKPAITSLSTTSGAVGTAVTITGTSFGSSQGSSTVTFNGTIATVTSWSATSLVTSVPTGATTGNVVVTVGGVASNGVAFTVKPAITSLSTTSGAVGTAVTITGTTFGSTQGSSTVTFNGTTATVTSWSATSLVTSVPTGATTGNVVVTVGGVASNGVSFTVTSGGGGGIKLVQHASVDAGITASSALAFPAKNTAGNWIGVCIRGGAASETFTVTDSRGNTYNKAIQTNQTDDGDTVAIFYAQNIAGGANTITVSETPTQSLRFAILEYSGVATSGSLDVTAAAQGNSTAPNSGTATTTANGDLLLGAVMTADPEAFTAGSGYVIEATAPAEPGTKVIAEDQIQTTAGTFSAGATLGAANDWAAVVAAFKP